MSIRFPCPHCKKPLSVKDHLAGKKAACPACKQPITIPKPAAAPANVEELAAAALAEQAAAPAAPVEVKTVDFRCYYCDEEVKVSAELAGKQTPCPACRRIIKVPLIVKNEPKDWRTVDTRAPAGARRDTEPAPEGAWGSTTSAGSVSRQALVEAEAIPVARARLTPRQWALRGSAVAGVLLLVFVSWSGFTSWNQNRQQSRALAKALSYLEGDKLSSEAAAEVSRAAGEFFLRANKIEEARTHFQKARNCLPAESTGARERDAVLIDLAVSQVELGGTPAEVEKRVRRKWEDVLTELRQTLQKLRAREARAEGLREVSRRLIARGEGKRAAWLVAQVSRPEEVPDALSLVGLELFRAGQTTEASTLAEQALQRFHEPLPPEAPEATDVPEKEEKPKPPDKPRQAPLTPALVALWVALDKRDPNASFPPAAATGPPAAVGHAEGLARRADLDGARRMAPADALPARVEALVAIAAALIANDQPEFARADLEEAAGLLQGELKGKGVSSWLLLRLVRLSAQAGLGERVQPLAGSIPDLALRGRAQLEVLRVRLNGTRDKADEAWAQEVDKGTPAHGLALEAVARHNARYGSGRAMEKAVDGWEPEKLRPFGYVGIALGSQDAGR